MRGTILLIIFSCGDSFLVFCNKPLFRLAYMFVKNRWNFINKELEMTKAIPQIIFFLWGVTPSFVSLTIFMPTGQLKA